MDDLWAIDFCKTPTLIQNEFRKWTEQPVKCEIDWATGLTKYVTREKGVKGWGKVIDFVPSEQPGYENCAAATTTSTTTSTTSTTTSTTSTTTSTTVSSTTTEATTAARTDVCTFDSLPVNEKDFVEGVIWNCDKSNDDLTNGSKCFKSCRTPDVNMQGTRNTVECKCDNAGCSWKGGTASCVQQFCDFGNLFWPNGVTCQLPDGTEVRRRPLTLYSMTHTV